jgi:hypothetical protein
MSYMTKIEGEWDRDSIRPGMAYFAGSGPFGETCGNCSHLGTSKARCEMFKRLTGRRGQEVDRHNAACKYFVARPMPPPIVPHPKP